MEIRAIDSQFHYFLSKRLPVTGRKQKNIMGTEVAALFFSAQIQFLFLEKVGMVGPAMHHGDLVSLTIILTPILATLGIV